MLAPLALFVALWVVFAPAWGRETGGRGEEGSDLAARVLAPTFEQGALRFAPFSKKLDEDQPGNWGGGEGPAPPILTITILAAASVSLIATGRPGGSFTERHTPRLGRAPPASSLCGRRPPSCGPTWRCHLCQCVLARLDSCIERNTSGLDVRRVHLDHGHRRVLFGRSPY
jgi:hypothetical protein